MEMQINDLVAAIKKDGVEAAQAEAEKILTEAKEKAAKILSTAKTEAENMVKKAEEKAEILRESVKTTAQQAKRDAMLSFKKSVQAQFERLLEEKVANTVDDDVLARLITAAINNEDPSLYTAEVAQVTEELKGKLSEKLKNGLEIKAHPSVRVGFKLTAKDGSGYFDCSDEELQEALAPFFPEIIL